MHKIKLLYSILAVTALLSSCKDDENSYVKALEEMERGTLVAVIQEKHQSTEEFISTNGYLFPGFALDSITSEILFQGPGHIDVAGASVDLSFVLDASKLVTNTVKPMVSKHRTALATTFAKEQKQLNPSYEMQTYSYTYRSVGVQGEPILLSAVVAFPNSKDASHPHTVSDININHHAIISFETDIPSRKGDIMLLRALQNNAVVCPDYEGLGASTEHFTVPMEIDVTSRQSVDAIVAAKEVMKLAGVKLTDNYGTESFGVSLGGEYLLAFHHYYDTKATAAEKDAVRLKQTYGGAGVVSPHMYFTNPEDVEGPFLYPATPLALNNLESLFEVPRNKLGGYDAYNDFCSPVYRNYAPEYIGGQSYFEYRKYSKQMPYNLVINDFPDYHMLFSDDMLTDDKTAFDFRSPKTVALFEYMKESDLGVGWNPKTPLTYVWSEQDDNLYPAMQKRACKNLGQYANGAPCTNFKQELVTLPLQGVPAHLLLCTYYYLKCISEVKPY